MIRDAARAIGIAIALSSAILLALAAIGEWECRKKWEAGGTVFKIHSYECKVRLPWH